MDNNFSRKEVTRAIRNINACMSDVLNNTGHTMFHTNIKRFIELIENDKVLNYLLKPFFEININGIEKDDGGWIELDIPSNIDYQIAYVLKKYKEISESIYKDEIHNFLLMVFKYDTGDKNAMIWNKEIVSPCFREIRFRLDDLLEDIPKDDMEVSLSHMSIINVGNVNNSGNLAIGNDIVQNNNSSDFFEDIIGLVNKNVKVDEQKEILEIIKELKENQNNKSKFKEIVTKFISKTAEYTPVFIEIWSKLNEMLQ
ncbi:TPA: hypothetical protein ACSQIM_002738 [Clostridium perfringens]|uniref:hypothetical protein n=1 Tax=Clostridium perfringens TaxID=1502 RepID=UPI001CC8F184|nr:hypothetical protein [Clostridium perfringens]MDK0615916.1 hypothetical protein [Clostridium perfringens]MDK0754805.1 hypothetical protein [Clostridium perfringens]MDK0758004.1 hypothetical protein [Clostridium perfringens]MDU6176085.1 hypothetical protein [Clostridium perfringens]UBK45568.1 hypothetical protein KLF41_00115 [Clostridium perfringens]